MPILDDPMREVLPDVNMLGDLSSANYRDVVALFNTRSAVFVHWRGLLFRKTQLVEEIAEVQHLRSRCRGRIVPPLPLIVL